jgi:multidrug efflux pump subunit AcrB
MSAETAVELRTDEERPRQHRKRHYRHRHSQRYRESLQRRLTRAGIAAAVVLLSAAVCILLLKFFGL